MSEIGNLLADLPLVAVWLRPDWIMVRGIGGVLKRSTRADCKSAGYAFGGSNPPPSTTSCAMSCNDRKRRDSLLENGGQQSEDRCRSVVVLAGIRSETTDLPDPWSQAEFCPYGCRMVEQGGCSSRAEPQPSKLMMWVRIPSPAPNSG